MRLGTLRGAARSLGVAPTTVGRRLTSLEAALGTPLFLRSDEGFTPTPAARALLESAQGVEASMTAIARQLAPAVAGVRGTVRISAIESLTAEVLAPSMPELLRRHPALRIHLQVDARVVSFAQGQVDIAVRLARPSGQRLVVRRAARIEMGLYASRTYPRNGPASTLAGERFVAYDDAYGAVPEREWFAKNGLDEGVALRTASTRALLQATIAGAGIALLPKFLVRGQADLVAVIGPPLPPPRPVYLVTHEDLRKQTSVNMVWDYLGAVLAQVG